MKEILNYRYYVLAVLVGVGFTLLLADTADMDIAKWLAYQFAFKVVGVVSLFVAYKLINYWNPKGKIDAFAKLEKLTSKLIEQ